MIILFTENLEKSYFALMLVKKTFDFLIDVELLPRVNEGSKSLYVQISQK